MSRKAKNKKKGQDRMNTVLTIDEYRSSSTPTKDSSLSVKKQIEHDKINVKKLVELESRQSSIDEFPLLWNDKEE